MKLKDVLGEIEADGANLVHGRLLKWALTPPLWHAEAVGGVHTIRARQVARRSLLAPHGDGVSAAFAIAHGIAAGDWGSGNPAFTIRALPSTQPPSCGARLRVMSRHALVPFPFRGLSRLVAGSGKPGGQKLCQSASFFRTLL